MATRTVRLDEDEERVLQEVRAATGLPISEVLKRGVRALRDQIRQRTESSPYDVYRQLDLGPGGYAIAPSTESRRGVRAALERKLRR